MQQPKYEFSHSENGPFMAFGWYDNPNRALEVAKTSLDCDPIYIARVVELDLHDIFPSVDILWADAMEVCREKYGASPATLLEEENGELCRSEIAIGFLKANHMDPIYVPECVVECPRNTNKLTDEMFRGKTTRKITEKKLKLGDIL